MGFYLSIKDYTQAVSAPSGRILSFDVGEKYIGLALSDTRAIIASPFNYYQRKSLQKDADYYIKILKDYSVFLIVVGLPLNLDGVLSHQGQRIVAYMEKLHDLMGIDIVFWDERFSTLAVERTLLQHDMSRKKREQTIDKLAATYILQGALDYFNHKKF